MTNFSHLNPDDFKKWMKNHETDDPQADESVVGMRVEAKFCGKKTARNITLESGRAGKVVREFVQQGGVIKSVEGEEYLIEVESGSFYINRRGVIL